MEGLEMREQETRPAFRRLSTGEYPTGYYQLQAVTPATAPDVARWIAKIPAQWKAVTGKRTSAVAGNAMPAMGMPACRYQDPARARTVEQVARELGTLIGRANTSDPTGRDAARCGQRALLEGYVTVATDGSLLVARPGSPSGQYAEAAPLFPSIVWAGELPVDAWRQYAPVRALARSTRAGAVTWSWGPWGVRWGAKDDDGDEAHGWAEWAPEGPAEPDPIRLADRYLWPCRGMGWRLGTVELYRTREGYQLHGLVLATEGLAVLVAGVHP